MYNQAERSGAFSPRLQWVDIARGIALIAMVVYHFTWDLSFFGLIAPQTSVTGGWAIFARMIAVAFLFLTGFSLFLANRNGIRWKAFFKRFIIIVGAALLISVATYFTNPQAYVYFGILHEIALTSLVGLLFLRTPILINILVIIFILTLGVFLHSGMGDMAGALAFFQRPVFSWTGLNFFPRPAADFVPFIPWFAAGLSGITVARILSCFHWLKWLQNGIHPLWLNKTMQWLGRHTLIIYLLHQPLLYGAVFLFVSAFPDATRVQMEESCVASCADENGVLECRRYCGCVFDEIQNRNLLGDLRAGKIAPDSSVLQSVIMQCQGEARQPVQ